MFNVGCDEPVIMFLNDIGFHGPSLMGTFFNLRNFKGLELLLYMSAPVLGNHFGKSYQ